MRHCAAFLQEIYDPERPVAWVCFLTGTDFWYQTVFCLYSLQKYADDIQINARFYDDGSLSQALREQLQKQFPHSRVIGQEMINARMEEILPVQRFPVIRRIRSEYPHLKKLTDIHADEKGWNLVMDSDMLFFGRPAAMIEWLRKTDRPMVLKDKAQSYGYSLSKLDELAGARVPRMLNVGITGLNSAQIDWQQLESWLAQLVGGKANYYLEQALIAMLMAGRTFDILDPCNYIVLPTKTEVIGRQGILHHYVAASKKEYFTLAWKTFR